MIVVGGEGFGSAHSSTFLFKPSTDRKVSPSPNIARHGTGLVVKCSCNEGTIYTASGDGAQGGAFQLNSTERLITHGSC
jgi:hypothetical protein